ncbi:unnamed protein product [Porites lobata]|uniref:Protein kinase domain-containing protein n=1 Tax=Porites lobata TaxID=104759 RepID=A0ABN8RVG8_9CNID|nr:unnamed protein product [Porites lobata]
MSDWLSRSGFTQICVIRGTVSLPGAGNGAGELQLWYHEKKNQYLIYALKTTGDDELFNILPETTMRVTEGTFTISYSGHCQLKLKDPDPNELQLFIDKMPASIKEKMQDLREANSPSRISELERQLRDFQQREGNFLRQLREMQEREENLQRQLRAVQERDQYSQRQLTEFQQREQNMQRLLRELQEREQNSQRQLTEFQQREENSQRQLTEFQQREQNFQRQLTEFQQRGEHSQRQLRELQRQLREIGQQLTNCRGQVSELQLSLSTAQQTINQLRNQGARDWVIPRDEIQITEKCLGKGGWGIVNEGTYCGCTVAVKEIHELILSPHNIRLFEREMNIASKCRHPHLLQFIGATVDEGSPLFVTELMEKSLRTLLEQRQLSETEIRTISFDLACALNYLHQKKPEPIIHRDVSSANVLLWRQDDQWRAKVSDYGTANFIQQTMTVAPGAMIYSAPEALASKQTVKVDVYSFGALLCEMCIRELPDPTRREEQVVLITNAVFRDLVRRCLQREPWTRPTMQGIIDELKDANVSS